MNSQQLLNSLQSQSKSDLTEVTDFAGVENLAFIDAIFQNTIHRDLCTKPEKFA